MKKLRINQTLFFILLLAVVSGCSSESTDLKEVLRPVRYLVVQKETVSGDRGFSGVSVAATETKISFRVSGLLEELNIKVGQKVSKGDVIAILDDRDLQLGHEESKAAVRNAEVQERNAKANLQRIRELYENNNVALSEYEQAKNSYAKAKADLESRRKQQELQQSQLQYSIIRSPMTGVVTQVPVARNENISAGAVVAVLSSDEDIEIEVGMPESYISIIRAGMSVQVAFSSRPGKSYSGVVNEVSYAAAEYSTYPVKVKLDRPDSTLRPGMPTTVRFPLAQSQAADIRIPNSAVAKDHGGSYVYLVQKTDDPARGVVERRKVVVGQLTGAGFIVMAGLEEGDLVVTAGVSKISHGMIVRIDPNFKQ